LDWRAKLKIKINFTKQLKGKTSKKIRTKSIKKSTNWKSWLKDKIENNRKSTKKARKKTRPNLKNSKIKILDWMMQL
jgi:hypothetical protein